MQGGGDGVQGGGEGVQGGGEGMQGGTMGCRWRGAGKLGKNAWLCEGVQGCVRVCRVV